MKQKIKGFAFVPLLIVLFLLIVSAVTSYVVINRGTGGYMSRAGGVSGNIIGYGQGDGSCAATFPGATCKSTSACSGTVQRGYCPGPATWMCCVPNGGATTKIDGAIGTQTATPADPKPSTAAPGKFDQPLAPTVAPTTATEKIDRTIVTNITPTTPTTKIGGGIGGNVTPTPTTTCSSVGSRCCTSVSGFKYCNSAAKVSCQTSTGKCISTPPTPTKTPTPTPIVCKTAGALCCTSSSGLKYCDSASKVVCQTSTGKCISTPPKPTATPTPKPKTSNPTVGSSCGNVHLDSCTRVPGCSIVNTRGIVQCNGIVGKVLTPTPTPKPKTSNPTVGSSCGNVHLDSCTRVPGCSIVNTRGIVQCNGVVKAPTSTPTPSPRPTLGGIGHTIGGKTVATCASLSNFQAACKNRSDCSYDQSKGKCINKVSSTPTKTSTPTSKPAPGSVCLNIPIASCSKTPGCSVIGTRGVAICIGFVSDTGCSSKTDKNKCIALARCSWVNNTCKEEPSSVCTSKTDKNKCIALSQCSWINNECKQTTTVVATKPPSNACAGRINGEKFCTDNTVSLCSNNGGRTSLVASSIATCPAGCLNGVCNTPTSACAGRINGEKFCTDNTVSQCTNNGGRTSMVAQSVATCPNGCLNGACISSTPSTDGGDGETPQGGRPGGGGDKTVPSDPKPSAGDVTLNFKFKFQGVTKKPRGDQSVRFKVKLQGPTKKGYESGVLTVDDNGIWNGSVSFSGLTLSDKKPDTNYTIFVKIGKHIQKRICKFAPSESAGGTYNCSESEVPLSAGVNNLDFSGILLLVGDLPTETGDQNGVVDSYDISYVLNNLRSTDPSKLKIGDLNFDGIIDTQDKSLIIQSLNVKYDDE